MTKKNESVPLDSRLLLSLVTVAELADCSVGMVRKEIELGYLTPSYLGAKTMVLPSEAKRWAESLPAERRGAAA